MLEFRNVSKKSKKFELKNISFTAEEGFITGIVGVNGAGKTTLINLLKDERANYDGEILFDGEDIKNNHDAFRGMLGFVSDDNAFFEEFTVAQNVDMLSCFYPEWNSEVFKARMKEFEVSTGKKVSALSRGERVRFQLAFAMAHNARLYVFDEATAGMDPVFRKDFFKVIHELIAAEPVTVIMTTHIEEDIRKHMDYIGVLDAGSLKSFSEVEQ